MELPTALSQASREGRLLALWGALPFPLAERPPADRAQALNRLQNLPESSELVGRLTALPPLPILSLDPTGQVERAFAHAGLSLQVVRSRRQVPAQGQHALLKLAGDLETRHRVVLSRAEVRTLRSDPDKRYLLDEARRRVEGGALLLLGCDPDNEDFRLWWSVLAPAFLGLPVYAVGEPSMPWPESMICLEADLEALSDALWAAQPPEPEPEPEAPAASAEPQAKYVINVYGPVEGLTIGDEARVEQRLGAPLQTIEGDWEALIAQVTGRLDDLSAQLGPGMDALKRAQAALYRQVDPAHREDLARLLAAVQESRLGQGEMQAALDALRRAMRAVTEQGLPADAQLRAAIADLTQALESDLSLEHKLELALPVLPLLAHGVEPDLGGDVPLQNLWHDLRALPPRPAHTRPRLPLTAWLAGGSLAITAALMALFFTSVRCALEYRVSEALAALIALLVGGIAGVLVKIAPPAMVRRLSGVVVGMATALLAGVIVHVALPPPSEQDCATVSPPATTLQIRLDGQAVQGQQTLTGNRDFVWVEVEILRHGTPVPPTTFEYQWSFNPSDSLNQDRGWSRVSKLDYHPPQDLCYQTLTVQVRGEGVQWSRSIQLIIEE